MELAEFLQTIKEESDHLPESKNPEMEIPTANFHASDDVARLERISIMAEAIEPQGERLCSGGKDLGVHAGDPPHIRTFAWALVHLWVGKDLPVDISRLAADCRMTIREARDALARLVKDGDLIRFWEGRREWYRLNVQYPEGGQHENSD